MLLSTESGKGCWPFASRNTFPCAIVVSIVCEFLEVQALVNKNYIFSIERGRRKKYLGENFKDVDSHRMRRIVEILVLEENFTLGTFRQYWL